MRPLELCARLVLLVWLLLAAAPAVADTTPAVVDLRVGVHADRTRIVLDLTGPVTFRVQALHDPARVAIDLPRVHWRVAHPPRSRAGDLIAQFRHGQFQPDTFRLVADLRHPAVVLQTLQLPPGPDGPHRVVVDLARRPDPPPQVTARGPAERAVPMPPPEAPRAQAAAAPPPVVTSEPPIEVARVQPFSLSVPTPKLRPHPALQAEPAKRIVVLDPGHGGRDVGAIGVTGTYEKDVVLAVALKLRDHLLASGRYEVVLTREADAYVGLRERLQTARQSRADAFISLHADSLDDHALRGASVYTLSDTASDKEAEALARAHNKAEILNGLDLSDHDAEVQRILIDLARRDTNNRSIDLASLMVTKLGEVTTLLRRDRRFGGFVVLKSPDVPSVLVELGFMSNSVDEANLRDPKHRDKLAQALARALDRYFFADQPS